MHGAEVDEPEAHDREVVPREPREHVVHHLSGFEPLVQVLSLVLRF